MKLQSPLLDALSERVLVWDGAMGTQIQGASLTPADFTLEPKPSYPTIVNEMAEKLAVKHLDGCNEVLNFTRPDVIETIHGNYFEAGSDMVETNTFGSTSIVLGEYAISELVYENSLAAAKIARRAAENFPHP